eukprot:343054-Hanusia_phi.AAC.1
MCKQTIGFVRECQKLPASESIGKSCSSSKDCDLAICSKYVTCPVKVESLNTSSLTLQVILALALVLALALALALVIVVVVVLLVLLDHSASEFFLQVDQSGNVVRQCDRRPSPKS